MEPFAWITLGVVAAIFGFLAFSRHSPDVILVFGLAVLALAGNVLGFEEFGPRQALAGFANEGMLTVAILFVVAAGIKETGAVWFLVNMLLGLPKTPLAAQIRMMIPVAGMSAFVNNTPLVAVLLPIIGDWAKKVRIPASKLMIPLSYAAILGGVCTLIGTSTNMVVYGLLQAARDYKLGFFEVSLAGIPCAIVGIAFIIGSSKWLLPDRTPAVSIQQDPREYVLEMQVEPGSPLVGKSIEEAGLRHLPGMYLMEIDRNGEVIAAVDPRSRLLGNDRLMFVGVVSSVVDLQKFPGLKPATDQIFKLNASASQRVLVEAVVSHFNPLLGKSIREGRFRSHYDAAIIAVSRHGERLKGRIGDIVLERGDTLLVEASESFLVQHRDSRDFYLVSKIEGYTPPTHSKAPLALAIMIGMIALATFEVTDMLLAGALAAIAMIATGCLSVDSARRGIDGSILLAIVASLGIGQAVESSGAAAAVAGQVLALSGNGPLVSLILVYGATMVASELLTNNAAAALLFPFALATADSLGGSYIPYVIAVMIAASSAFATPIGYQTNLMVYGPGGYRFSDYLRIGIPLDIILWITAMIVIPLAYPFHP